MSRERGAEQNAERRIRVGTARVYPSRWHRLGLPDPSPPLRLPRAAAGVGSELGCVEEQSVGPAASQCIPTVASVYGSSERASIDRLRLSSPTTPQTLT